MSSIDPLAYETRDMTLPADPTTAAGLPAVGGRRPLPLSALVVVQVLALAFILASFPVRNADFWSHLAVGRTISDGAYRFGVDPLAYTTAGIYWANTAWLFDFLLYHAFTALGDGVVLLKATFVVCLAGVLLLGRRPGSGAVVPALMTALVLLAMAPRLMLQPGLVSAGLLAVTTVILLGRGGKAARAQDPLCRRPSDAGPGGPRHDHDSAGKC